MKGYQEIFSIDVFRGCTEAEVIIVHRGSINYYLHPGLKVQNVETKARLIPLNIIVESVMRYAR